MDMIECETCTEDCPKAKAKHEAATGRMYALHELAKCAPYWEALFDEDGKPRINPDRLRELVEADRDGRCMVLPLKPGGEVYYIGWSACSNGWDDPGECGGCDNDCDSRRVVKSMRVHSYSWIVENFIERENHYYHTSYHDAEAALNGETYGQD